MTLVTAYGRNGKIFSVWRVSTARRKFRFHKGDRMVCEFEARPAGATHPLDHQVMQMLQGHQPLIDELLRYLQPKDTE